MTELIPITPNDPSLPSIRTHDRVTVVVNLHHEHEGDKPTSRRVVAYSYLEEKEQTYSRLAKQKLKQDWVGIDFGWIDKPGVILIENMEGTNVEQALLPDEIRELDRRIIEVSLEGEDGGNLLLVRPRWPLMIEVQDPSKIRLRCQYGEAGYRVTVISR